MIQVGLTKRKLLIKENSNISNYRKNLLMPGTNSLSLATFVEEKEYCPDCKKHMILAKNQKGVSYLRCSNKNCKKVKYLTADLINWYISKYNINCPRNDGGELRGMLGKYGPCIKCSRGHFLKPEEI